MKIETTLRDDHQARIVAEFEPEFMDKFKRQAARKISQEARIPGFRPGKAPYDMVRRIYGEDMIEKQAVEIALEEAYPQVLKEAAVEPSGPGDIETVESYNPLKIVFIVPLAPKVELGDYRSIRKEYNLPVVGDEEVEKVIKNLRYNYATAEPVERPVAEGDLVSVKISGLLTQAAEGEDAEAFKESTTQMIVGSDEAEENQWPFEGYARELIGLSANEEKTVTHTYPEDYSDEKLRGKEVSIAATVLTVKAFHLPELNEEFAQMLGGFSSIDALRDRIRQNMLEETSQNYNETYFNGLFDELIGMSKVMYPPQALQEEIEGMLHNLEHNLEERKMDLATYIKTLGKDRETFIAEDVRPAAKRRLERSLVMSELAQAEKIQLNPDELERAVGSRLQLFQGDPEFSKLRGQRAQNFMQNLTMDTATSLLNQAVLERFKAIASGQAEASALDETSPVEEVPAEPAPEAAPEAEPTGEPAPTEDKPAEA